MQAVAHLCQLSHLRAQDIDEVLGLVWVLHKSGASITQWCVHAVHVSSHTALWVGVGGSRCLSQSSTLCPV